MSSSLVNGLRQFKSENRPHGNRSQPLGLNCQRVKLNENAGRLTVVSGDGYTPPADEPSEKLFGPVWVECPDATPTESPDVVKSDPALSQYLHDPDVQLMLRAKRGDDSAFSQLVENYQDRLVGVLYHLLGNQEAAEDLGQEVFLRIYRNRTKYEAKAKFSTWLFHIANNLASNWRRDGARRRESQLAGSDSGPLGARPHEQLLAEKSALMPARVLDRNESQLLVQAALESLSDRQKMAVLLHKFEQMSYIDIAETMDLSPQAVKSLLSRARENLRAYLEPYL